MAQEPPISITKAVTVKSGTDSDLELVSLSNVSGTYTRSHFHTWVNFSSSNSPKHVENTLSEKIGLQLSSAEEVISFIKSLVQASFVKFRDDSVQKGRFEVT